MDQSSIYVVVPSKKGKIKSKIFFTFYWNIIIRYNFCVDFSRDSEMANGTDDVDEEAVSLCSPEKYQTSQQPNGKNIFALE